MSTARATFAVSPFVNDFESFSRDTVRTNFHVQQQHAQAVGGSTELQNWSAENDFESVSNDVSLALLTPSCVYDSLPWSRQTERKMIFAMPPLEQN